MGELHPWVGCLRRGLVRGGPLTFFHCKFNPRRGRPKLCCPASRVCTAILIQIMGNLALANRAIGTVGLEGRPDAFTAILTHAEGGSTLVNRPVGTFVTLQDDNFKIPLQ